MLSVIEGLVVGISRTWTITRNTEYKKIMLAFPNEELPRVWCTVFDRGDWGYVEDRLTGKLQPIAVRPGHIVRVTGRYPNLLETGPYRSFTAKDPLSRYGAIQLVKEFRDASTITLPTHMLTPISNDTFIFSVENSDGCRFYGKAKNAESLYKSKAVTIKGNALIVNVDTKGLPIAFNFDDTSNGKITAYGRKTSEAKGWRESRAAPSGVTEEQT